MQKSSRSRSRSIPSAANGGRKVAAPATSEPRPGSTGTATPPWRILREILAATYWFDPGEQGKPYSTSIRFTGRRVDITGKPEPGDRFIRDETLDGIVPGSGPISLTTFVNDVNPGEWTLSAECVAHKSHGRVVREFPGSHHGGAGRVRPLLSPWRKPEVPTRPGKPIRTAMIPFVRIPGVVPGAWPAFVGLGVLAGLAIQALLLAQMRLDVLSALLASLSAMIAGAIGAKVWYLVLHHRRRAPVIEGLCIQGFLLGAAVVGTAAVGLLRIPIGPFLDATAPGLLLGMAIGRPGCFFAGCCSGKPTASRWGVWASNRRVGTRRIPTQLMESLVCLGIGLAALAIVVASTPARPGLMFVGALAAYTLCRQLLLPLRSEPRKSSIGPRLTMAGAALVLLAAIVLSVVP